jgi:hypothetical protein
MTAESIMALVAAAFLGLIGIIYGNMKAEINRNRDTCEENHAETAEWQKGDNEFKVEVVDRLARLETLIRNGGSDAI